MSRYNPDYHVAPIYEAAQKWRDKALTAEQSVLADGKKLWTLPLLDELDQCYVQNLVAGKGFISRLKEQLAEGSDSCHQLMAEILWLLYLFPFPSIMRAATKRKSVMEIWSWSGEKLDPTHPLLEDAVLGGIGLTGPEYNRQRWRELVLFINALRDFKARDASEQERIASDPWAFSDWLSGFPEEGRRHLIHILPHLLFPDTFERISSGGDKCLILTCFIDTSEKEIQKWSTVEIDRALLDLRQRLEKKHGREIDFYEEEFEAQWKTQTKKTQTKAPPQIKTDAATPKGGAGPGNAPPKNLILYGPPGTGKTRCLMIKHLPRYKDEGGDRFEFVTFHQSYAYEDFVEGIRPITENGTVTYEVKPGVLKRLCDRARYAPDKQFALFIDEINRGNIAKIFGELITLIEVDKRIHTDASGKRLTGCKGLEVTLPYSDERFGVPANIDVIGTMNTADRSIALLDSALRRRFQFEELTPKPELLGSIDDGEGEGGSIDLRKLLQAMNARLSHLLHRDQTLGHSYFFHVKSFDELRHVFAKVILPFLQEAFYDDWQQIRYVLADQAVEEKEIQLVRVQTQNAATLFPKADPAEIGVGETFEIIQEGDITPNAIRKIYQLPE